MSKLQVLDYPLIALDGSESAAMMLLIEFAGDQLLGTIL